MNTKISQHNLWINQLRGEFHAICRNYRVQLRPPILEISSSTGQYGCWFPQLRTLKISAHLITNYSWDVTINVLKHEMAHQLCTEVFTLERAGHGPDFLRACELLGVPEPFRHATGDLPAGIAAAQTGDIRTEEGRRVIGKVKKLLALAGSDNEYEAALAMRKAGDLMARHNLQQLELAREDGYIYRIIATGRKQMPGYQRVIAAILRDYFHVYVVHSFLYDPRVNETQRTIELLGREENVIIAEHCFHFLSNRLRALWQQQRAMQQRTGITERNSYYLGLLRGFREKLDEQAARYEHRGPGAAHAAVIDLRGLIVAEDQRLQEFVAQRFPKLVYRRRSGSKICPATYQQGVATGRTIVLHHAVTEQGAGVAGLLEE